MPESPTEIHGAVVCAVILAFAAIGIPLLWRNFAAGKTSRFDATTFTLLFLSSALFSIDEIFITGAASYVTLPLQTGCLGLALGRMWAKRELPELAPPSRSA